MSPFRAVLGAIHVQVIDRPSPDAPSLTQTSNCANGLFSNRVLLYLKNERRKEEKGQENIATTAQKLL